MFDKNYILDAICILYGVYILNVYSILSEYVAVKELILAVVIFLIYLDKKYIVR